jgi:hypothetical protein
MRTLVKILAPILVFFTASVVNASCDSVGLFKELENLKEVGTLHNCQIEVLSQQTDTEKKISLRLVNTKTCKGASGGCVETLLGMRLDRACFDGVHEEMGKLAYSRSYSLEDETIVSFINMRKDYYGNIVKLDAGEFSTNTGFINRALCVVE